MPLKSTPRAQSCLSLSAATAQATLDDFSDDQRRPYCAAYVSSDMSVLRAIVDQYIFRLIYPNALVRGIAELTESVLASQFPSWRIGRETHRISFATG